MRVRPLPELADPRAGPPYRVYEGRPRVSIDERLMLAPLTPDVEARQLRRHECAHVRWSPGEIDVPEGADPRLFLAAEDARVDRGLSHLGLGLPDVTPDQRQRIGATVVACLSKRCWRTLAASIVSTAGSAVLCGVYLAKLRSVDGPPEWSGHLALIERAVAITESVLTKGERGAVVAPRRVARDLAVGLTKMLRALPPDDPAPDVPPDLRPGRGMEKVGGAPPGTMTVVETPMPHWIPEAHPAPRWRCAAEGTIVRAPHRGPVDGAVFGRRLRRRASGGTVLVDNSASMRLTPDALDAMLRQSPPATIAIYSGDGLGGTLKIVARRGRRAAAGDLSTPGIENVIDLPALAWLGSQPRPRIWLSDGVVTGIHDRWSETVAWGCQEVVGRAGIRRCRTPAEVIKCLR